jgi:hypothetical protein
MAVQDDKREEEMLWRFNLERPENFGRADIDAILELKGPGIPDKLQGVKLDFELKSATSGEPDISTGRDVGMGHIKKWRTLHWIFGVYGPDKHGELKLQYCLYGSPKSMKNWLDDMEAYAAPDFALAEHVPELIGPATLTAVLGEDETFTYAGARRLMKNQYRRENYRQAADLPDECYSRKAMLSMLRDRCKYLLERGSTRNNPHIPPSYFENWERIKVNHAARLRELVVEALQPDQSVASLSANSPGHGDSNGVGQRRRNSIPDLAENHVRSTNPRPVVWESLQQRNIGDREPEVAVRCHEPVSTCPIRCNPVGPHLELLELTSSCHAAEN